MMMNADTAEQLGDWLFVMGNGPDADLADVSGFKPLLVGGGQKGQVARHIEAHGGATMIGFGQVPDHQLSGWAATIGAEADDWRQGLFTNKNPAEFAAEVADDHAAREVAAVLEDALREKARLDELAKDPAQRSSACRALAQLPATVGASIADILCN
jgi:hypothetical protein